MVDRKTILECIRHPKDRRNFGLGVRCHEMGRTMKVQSAFTQRFTMIRYVEQVGIGPILAIEQVDDFGQKFVCICNGVVICVDDFLLRTVHELRRPAG